VVGAINMLIEHVRSAHVPVVWVRHGDEDLQAGGAADWRRT
jgi:PHD/YefM family antitoxin component YafN of YafNO toxin-antitoxin module